MLNTATAEGREQKTDGAPSNRGREPCSRFVVRHRPPRGKGWNVVGTADTHAAAVRLMSGPGDWHIAGETASVG